MRPVGAEADDDEACVERLHRLEQHLHALLLDQLPEVDDGRGITGEELLEPLGVPFVRQALFRVAGVGRVGARCLEQRGKRGGSILEHEQVDVDTRRHLVHDTGLADDVGQDAPDVLRADVGDLRVRERLAPPLLELGPAAHRVLELGAVRLDAERLPGGGADGAAEQDVVGEDQVGRQQLAERGRVRLDVRGLLCVGELLQQLRAQPLVAVEHEDRQEPVRELGVDDGGRAEIELLRCALLADDDDLVPGLAPLTRERT